MKGNKTRIVPLGEKILLRPLPADTGKKTAAGIIIPETIDKEKPEQGIVVAVGEGRLDDSGKRVPPQVKPGDKVLFSKYSPDEVKIDGEEYYIISESSVLAIIK